MSQEDNTRKPHNHFDELTPAQKKEYAKMEAMAAKAKEVERIGKAQWDFDPNRFERFKLTSDDGNGDGKENRNRTDPKIKIVTEDILNRYRFITIEESREILVYDNGVYAQGGEVMIEKTAESLYGFKLANRAFGRNKGPHNAYDVPQTGGTRSRH